MLPIYSFIRSLHVSPLFKADSLPIPGIPETECRAAIIEIMIQDIWFGGFLKLVKE